MITNAEAIARAASSKVGVRESGGNNKGKELAPFFAADDYQPNATDDGYPWCAAFVCWCVQVALAGRMVSFKRPTTPSAWGFEAWCKSVDRSVMLHKPHKGDIRRGDIVVFTFSHIGIAVGDASNGRVATVEGNTDEAGSREGGGVFRKSRKLSEIRSVIRFR
jgi:hypothetical protein